MEKVNQLLAALQEHGAKQDLVKDYGTIETASDCAQALLSSAQKLGIETDVDVAELVAYLESMEASEKAATDQAAQDVLELEDSDLEHVAGGSDLNCGKSADEAFSHAFECGMNDRCATWFWN